MDHVHFGNTKEKNQVVEVVVDSLNISVNESLQIFQTKEIKYHWNN